MNANAAFDRVSPAGSDAIAWLLASDEPAARWIALTMLLGRAGDDPEAVAARRAVVDDPGTRALVSRLPDWEAPGAVSGHDSPAYAPNLLGLLADMGVAAGDFPEVARLLESMLRHLDADGRFAALGTGPKSRTPAWGSLLCDNHAIAEVLIRYGFGADERVATAVARIEPDLAATADGLAWPCIPSLGFRGPGRKGDACPQVTLEAVRLFARLPDPRPPCALEGARTLLSIWRRRGERQPYMFGHGARFKTVKWPPFWYSSLAVVDAVGRYPEVFAGPAADPADRRALAEIAASLIAYNFDLDGRVRPRSCYRTFEAFSFGQKREASPFATALALAALGRLEPIAAEVASVDVRALASSRGGTGTARPPA